MFILGMDEKNTYKALEEGLSGVIFFTKDINSFEGFKNLIKNLKKHALIEPFMSIDQEGGRVERTLNLHNGSKYLCAQKSFNKGFNFLETQTQEIAKELNSFGINLNFAPCVDVNSNPQNPIIGERAFSNNSDEVITAAKIVTNTYRQNKIIPCIKHFPGHGDTSVDSHLQLPYLDMSLDEMEKIHIKPFKALIEENIEMIMVAHLNAKCFETENIPTSLSRNTIGYLRNILKYDRILISDDMFMKALDKYGFETACEMGIRAGLNLFIYREANDEIIQMIENIYQKALTDNELKHNIESSFEKISALKNHAFKTLTYTQKKGQTEKSDLKFLK